MKHILIFWHKMSQAPPTFPALVLTSAQALKMPGLFSEKQNEDALTGTGVLTAEGCRCSQDLLVGRDGAFYTRTHTHTQHTHTSHTTQNYIYLFPPACPSVLDIFSSTPIPHGPFSLTPIFITPAPSVRSGLPSVIFLTKMHNQNQITRKY